MAIINFTDFSGGYATDLAPESFEPNMLRKAENVYWRNELKKRQGADGYNTTDITSDDSIRGCKRGYIHDDNYTIIAIDDGSHVNFHYGLKGTSGTTISAIDDTFDWTTGYDVSIDYLEEMFVCGNGVDDMCIIYYDSGWQIETMDEYDTRDYDDIDWYAGQYDESEDTYTDDTDDAQSTTADDFQICTGVNNDGIWISCDYQFTKIIFDSVADFTTEPTVSYQYYQGDDTWNDVTLETTPTWSPGSEGDRTLEFAWPTDWEKWDGDEERLAGRYVLRIKFTANAEDISANYIELYHTHYVTQILNGEKPSVVKTHLNRIYIACGNAVNCSQPFKLTDWYEFDVDYFSEGGDEVLAMESFGEYLIVVKEGQLYGYFGNQYSNREIKKLSTHGAIAKRSCATVQGTMYYVAKDGIRGFNGFQSKLLSRHIQTDINGYTLSEAAISAYQGEVYISFPSSEEILWFDPDSYRTIDPNEYGRVSFFKLTDIRADILEWYVGSDDNGYLIVASNPNTGPEFLQLENGNAYDEASTTIPVAVQTRRVSDGGFQRDKRYIRIKVDIGVAGDYTFTIYGEDESVTATKTLESGSGSGHHRDDISVPYTCDGKNISFGLENDTINDFTVYGFALEVERRRF